MFLLIVDDNLLSATRLLGQAQTAGWTAKAVGLGPEGLTQARAWRPEVVVVNLASRTQDATLFIRALKAEPDLAPIPVLGFCSHRDLRRREAALAAGCDRVVSNAAVSDSLPALVRAMTAGTSRIGQGA
jgi:CheY-like chemotaxis protein